MLLTADGRTSPDLFSVHACKKGKRKGRRGGGAGSKVEGSLEMEVEDSQIASSLIPKDMGM